MKLDEIIQMTSLQNLNDCSLDKDIQDIYIGDLLSFVMANGKEAALWLTVQRHVNVVAVAELNDFSGIVFVEGVEPDEDTISKANEYHIPLLVSSLDAYTLAKLFAKMGL